MVVFPASGSAIFVFMLMVLGSDCYSDGYGYYYPPPIGNDPPMGLLLRSSSYPSSKSSSSSPLRQRLLSCFTDALLDGDNDEDLGRYTTYSAAAGSYPQFRNRETMNRFGLQDSRAFGALSNFLRGPPGPSGPAGPTGPAGPVGPAGPAGTSLSPSKVTTVTAAEAASPVLTCTAGTAVNIIAATYFSTDLANPCGKDVADKLFTACQGKSPSCTFTVSNANLGGADPCPGKPKELKVYFNCV